MPVAHVQPDPTPPPVHRARRAEPIPARAPAWAALRPDPATARVPAQRAAANPPDHSTSALPFRAYLPFVQSGNQPPAPAPAPSPTLEPSPVPSPSPTPAPEPSTIRSDDFNAASLNTAIWSFVNPSQEGSYRINGTNLLISVPAGTADQGHDLWEGETRAPQLMQPANNVDFSIEVKFETAPAGRYTDQGIIVQQDGQNFLRFDFYTNGSKLYLFAAQIRNGRARLPVFANNTISSGIPLYMRVLRTGDTWTQLYSSDGQNWNTGSRFKAVITVAAVGVYVGNSKNSPAYTASIDYFFNTASPIFPEDPHPELNTDKPTIYDFSYTRSATAIQVSWKTDRESSGKVEYGTKYTYELGSVIESGVGFVHSVTLNDLQPATTYHFRAVSVAGGQTGATPNQVTRTPAAAADAPVIDVWYGPTQTFGQHGKPQRWVNILGRVTDPDGVASLTYALNGGPPKPMGIGPDGVRLVNPGDFNADIAYDDLQPGNNTVTFTATDTLSKTSVLTVTVKNQFSGQAWPLPYTADWGSGKIEEIAQIVDGLWTRDEIGIRTVEPGYDRLINLGDINGPDCEVTVPFVIHGYPPTYGAVAGVVLRWQGHFPSGPGTPWPAPAQPGWGWYPLGGIGTYWTNDYPSHPAGILIQGNGPKPIGTTRVVKLDLEVRYIMKMRVESNAEPNPESGYTSTVYRIKVWKDGTPEPEGWDVSGTGIAGELTKGSVLLISHLVDVSYGNATITPL